MALTSQQGSVQSHVFHFSFIFHFVFFLLADSIRQNTLMDVKGRGTPFGRVRVVADYNSPQCTAQEGGCLLAVAVGGPVVTVHGHKQN